MVIDHINYYNKLKKKRYYGEQNKKQIKMLDKLYEWQVVDFSCEMNEFGNVSVKFWEDEEYLD